MRLTALALVALAALATAQSLGCATPEQRHRLLTYFFDGVPPLHPELPEPAPDELAEGTRKPGAPQAEAVQSISIHGPVAAKECEQCHSGSRSKQLVEPKPDLCWSCHDRKDFPGEFVHGPFAAGFCEACHNPHRSRNPHLLVRPQAELCQGCHDQPDYSELGEHRIAKGDDCQGCHDPHAAGQKYMLTRDEEHS